MLESDEISVNDKERYSEIYLFDEFSIIKIGLFLRKDVDNIEMIRSLFMEGI